MRLTRKDIESVEKATEVSPRQRARQLLPWTPDLKQIAIKSHLPKRNAGAAPVKNLRFPFISRDKDEPVTLAHLAGQLQINDGSKPHRLLPKIN
jgi:hypothetical protein